MLSRVSNVKVSVRPEGRKRLPLVISFPRGRHHISVVRCLSATASKRTLSTRPGRNWVKEQTELDTLPLSSNFSKTASEETSVSQDWLRLRNVCSCGLSLLRASLKNRWNHVEAAVYCKGSEMSPARSQSFKFSLVTNMDLLDKGDMALPFADQTLLITDTKEGSSEMNSLSYLLQHEMVEIPSRSCLLFPLVGIKNEVVGLFLLSVPQHETTPIITNDEMAIVNECKTLLLSGLEQYLSLRSTVESSIYQSQMTKSLLKEGRNAAKSVRSYARMLSFRPTAGELEKDMISGIEQQGARMSNIVHRLETTLATDPEHLPVYASFTSDVTPFLEN